MRLSVVTTMYRSAPYLEEFYERLRAAATHITNDYELIFVNDGSPDDSLAVALRLYACDIRVRVIDLSRNFGHHKAMMTGLAHAQGDLVYLTDCDLEVEPELLETFYAELQRRRVDVVFGVQQRRSDHLLNRLAAEWFYIVYNLISHANLPHNLVTERLMTRRYVQALVQHQERELLIAGLWVITGFQQAPLEVAKAVKGKTTYNFTRKIAHFVDAITSFSNQPLIFIFYLGLLISLAAGSAALYLIGSALSSGLLPGWPSLIVSVWLLGGLTIFCLGIIGIYLSKIFTEVKQRPYTIIRQQYIHEETELDEPRANLEPHGIILQREA
jgi:putative glycosyltransferase